MGYVGNQTTTSFTSMDKQTITGTGASTYTLSHNVSSESEIEVFVNNIRQEGGSGKAYTVSNNQITFSENINSTDDCYVIFQGKAIQTVVPPDGSVTSAKLDTNIAVSGNLDVGTIRATNGTTAMTVDTSGRVLTPARPAFNVWYSGGNLASVNTIVWNNEEVNVGSHYNTSNGRFTAPINGVYFFSWFAMSTNSVTEFGLRLQVDGSNSSHVWNFSNSLSSEYETLTGSTTLSLNASQYVTLSVENGTMLGVANYHNNFCGYLVG